MCIGDVESVCEKIIGGWPETGHNVPIAPATDTKQVTSVMGTFDANVPITSPQRPHAEDRNGIDLATLREAAGAEPP